MMTAMIRFIIDLYIYLLIADAILSYFPQFKNQPWAMWIRKICDYTTAPIRKIIPQDLPFDISPLIVIVILQAIKLLW